MDRSFVAYPVLLTVHQVAEILGVNKNSVYRFIDEGRIEAVRIGHSLRVPRTALAGMLNLSTPHEMKN